jgi:hypothetical protein
MEMTTHPLCAADRHLFVVRNDDVKIIRVPEEDGAGYRAIVKRNPAGDGWDVIRILDK